MNSVTKSAQQIGKRAKSNQTSYDWFPIEKFMEKSYQISRFDEQQVHCGDYAWQARMWKYFQVQTI